MTVVRIEDSKLVIEIDINVGRPLSASAKQCLLLVRAEISRPVLKTLTPDVK